MIPGLYGVGARMLLAMVRGWLWLGERLRAPGERHFAYQFLLGLLGMSLSMAELQRSGASGDATRNNSTCVRQTGYASRRAAHLRPNTARKPRERGARLRRRSAFRAENPRRILRIT